MIDEEEEEFDQITFYVKGDEIMVDFYVKDPEHFLILLNSVINGSLSEATKEHILSQITLSNEEYAQLIDSVVSSSPVVKPSQYAERFRQ